MGYRHSREQILDGAVDVALAGGLATLTFGRVAAHLGIADRTVVYYLAGKDELVTAVLTRIGERLQAALAPAVEVQANGHRDLVRRVWPLLARRPLRAATAVYLEAIGLAASGAEPYRTLAPALTGVWVDWLAERLDGPRPHRRREAEAALALVEGLLVVSHLLGATAAERAFGLLADDTDG